MKDNRKRRHIAIGDHYGRLEVLSPVAGRKWLCKCICGTILNINGQGLLTGNTQSCGCIVREKGSNNYKHGHTQQHLKKTSDPKYRAYCAWGSLRQRCGNVANQDYPSYGGRGITVDPRWQVFENFLADMGEPPVGMSLDRIDNDGPYSKDNCRWEVKEHQMRNRRNCRRLTYNGETKTMAQWARQLGIGHSALLARVDRGWSIERALGTPGATARRTAADGPWSGVLSLPA